ncbi:MAG: hypothetical protein JW820_19220 [Spirochaetales bacterium]|nr:hypothetical protein [Spirochaetales bacterium]
MVDDLGNSASKKPPSSSRRRRRLAQVFPDAHVLGLPRVDCGAGLHNLGRHPTEHPNGSDITVILTLPRWDHLMGFPRLRPAHSQAYRIDVKGGPIAKQTVRDYLEHQMQPPYCSARFGSTKA